MKPWRRPCLLSHCLNVCYLLFWESLLDPFGIFTKLLKYFPMTKSESDVEFHDQFCCFFTKKSKFLVANFNFCKFTQVSYPHLACHCESLGVHTEFLFDPGPFYVFTPSEFEKKAPIWSGHNSKNKRKMKTSITGESLGEVKPAWKGQLEPIAATLQLWVTAIGWITIRFM